MAKKNKIAKTTIATALVASAIIPVAVAPVAAAAEPVSEVVYEKDGKLLTLSFGTFTDALNAEALTDLDIKYVKAADGNYYLFNDFTDALNASESTSPAESLTEALATLAANAETLAKELENVAEGKIEGGVVVGSDDEDPIATAKAALEAAITAAEAVSTEGKTEESAKVLTDAIAAAKALVEKEDVTAAELEAAVTDLDTAKAGLKDVVAALAVESVSAINKTTIQLTLSKEVDSVTATNFTIAGGNVTAASLAADKKTVTLAVSGLNYATEYTVQTKDIVVNGTASDFGSKTFTTKAVTDLWELQITTLDANLLADGSDNTEVTFKLVDKTTGEVDKNADNVVLDLNTTYGTLASKRVTVQDGVATVLLTSEFSNTDISTKIDAQIIEASGDYKDLINHVVGTVFVPFKTTTTENVDTVTLVSAEANQADRVTLFFDKEITLKHFVAANAKGELLYLQSGSASDKVAKDLEKVDAALISHKLIKAGNVKISQGTNENFTIKGFKPVAGNSKAIEVILDKTTVLKDNADVKIDVITTNSIKKETNSSASFKVTDARKPEATSVTTEGLNTLKVKFSEAIDVSTFQIDGQYKGVPAGTAIDAAPTQNAAGVILGQNKNQAFTYEFGEFNPATLADNRDLATIKLTPHYWEAGDNKLSGFFSAGSHTIQASSTKDFAAKTDSNNIGSTQNLNFTIAADTLKPTATVVVESPEQFRLKFDKAVSATESEVQAFITTSNKVKLQVKNATTGNYEDADGLVAGKGQVAKASDLIVTRVSATEFIIELAKDWTVIHDTDTTNKNYYNYEYRLLIAKDTFTNVANGLKNEELQLNLNYAGSALNTPDTTSPIISNVERVGTSAVLNVTMNEPVKLVNGTPLAAFTNVSRDNAGETKAQKQTALTTTTVQFLGKDKDGKTVTINGNVGDYIAADNGLDAKFSVNWTGVAKTPQAYVDEGGSTQWTVVVRNISDDVGNDASSATFDITLEKSAAGETPFFVEQYTTAENAFKVGKYKVEGTGNGAAEDKVVITFSEGVQFTGNSDATNPANYTLNGVTLPTGTSISVSDVDTTDKGLETVTITLPDGTLNIGANVSNVITINKNLVSHDNSKIQGETTLIVNVDENIVAAMLAPIGTTVLNDTANLDLNGAPTPISINTDKAININITGNLNGQNLTVNAPNAHVVYNGTNAGTITIVDVANNSFTFGANAIAAAIAFNDTNGGRLVMAQNATAPVVTLGAGANATLAGNFGTVTTTGNATVTLESSAVVNTLTAGGIVNVGGTGIITSTTGTVTLSPEVVATTALAKVPTTLTLTSADVAAVNVTTADVATADVANVVKTKIDALVGNGVTVAVTRQVAAPAEGFVYVVTITTASSTVPVYRKNVTINVTP